MKFNVKQQESIDFYKGACAVIASAGSGKSTVLLERIRNLVENHNVPETDILTISFTRNTADELKKKLKKMGYTDTNIGTFHSICASILAKENVYLTHDKMIAEWQIEKLFTDGKLKVDVKDVMGFISYQKNYLKSYNDKKFEEKESNYSEIELRKWFKQYEEFKNKNGLHDFDDYMILCLDMLRKNPNKYTYEFVLVDEHQDSNLVQNLLLKELCKSNNIWCCFDYRQNCYKWRGSNPEYCMNFTDEWKDATVINMDINYRSANNIVDRSNKFIEQYYGDYIHYSDSIPHNTKDGNIKIYTSGDRESEGKQIVDKIEQLIVNDSKPSEIAVLYRLNAHSIYIENELKKRDIEYDIANDSSFFKRKEIAAILAYMKLIINPTDDGAFMEIFKFRNYPLAYFSQILFNDMKKYSGTHNISMFEALTSMRYTDNRQEKNALAFESHINKLRLQNDKHVNTEVLVENIIRVFQIKEYIELKYTNLEDKNERLDSLEILKTFVKSDSPEKFIEFTSRTKRKNKDNCVKLMSIHASKGLEFDNVFVVGIEDRKFPHEKSDLVDEARLFYVGVTRARENLGVSQIGHGNRFVKEYGMS